MITGGFGFVGSHLCDALLKDKHDLIILTRSYSKKNNIKHIQKKIIIEKIDVTNFKKLKTSIEKNKPDVIIHLAGETSHSKSFENPIRDIELNAKSTLYILEIIRTLNLKCRFILGSTFIVIGKPTKLPINEESPCNPNTIYGTNRLASEHYSKIYNKMYGLDTIIFRITNSYGPREQYVSGKNAINYLLYRAYKGEKISLYDKGKTIRDLIYISDVISGIKTIMKKGKPGELYWISSYQKTPLYKIGQLLKKYTNTTVSYVESPSYARKVDVGNFVVDNKKLKSLGWQPKVSISKGIQYTLNYFQSVNL